MPIKLVRNGMLVVERKVPALLDVGVKSFDFVEAEDFRPSCLLGNFSCQHRWFNPTCYSSVKGMPIQGPDSNQRS